MAKYTIGGIGSRVVLEDGQYFGSMDTEEDTALVVRLLNEHAAKLPWPRSTFRVGMIIHRDSCRMAQGAGWPQEFASAADLRFARAAFGYETCNICKPERE